MRSILKATAALVVFTISLTSFCNLTLADTPFTVGVSLPLTGALAEYGEAVKNGISLAEQENSELLKDVKFIYDDNKYEPKSAVGSFQKLAQFNKVNLMLIWGNEPALAVSPIAEKQKIPTIVIAQHEETSANKDYIVRFINTGEQYSEVMLDYLRRDGAKKFPVVKSELSFFNMLFAGLEKYALPDETVELVDSYPPDQTDFRTTILKLKNRKAPLVGLYLLPVQLREFFKQAAELNYKFHAFGSTPFESRSVFGELINLMEGSVYTHNGATEQFRKNYVAKFKNDMHLAYAANAYQFAVLTAQLVKANAPFQTPLDLIDAFKNTPPGTGPAGDYQVVKTKDHGYYFKFPISVNKVTTGSPISVFTNTQ